MDIVTGQLYRNLNMDHRFRHNDSGTKTPLDIIKKLFLIRVTPDKINHAKMYLCIMYVKRKQYKTQICLLLSILTFLTSK